MADPLFRSRCCGWERFNCSREKQIYEERDPGFFSFLFSPPFLLVVSAVYQTHSRWRTRFKLAPVFRAPNLTSSVDSCGNETWWLARLNVENLIERKRTSLWYTVAKGVLGRQARAKPKPDGKIRRKKEKERDENDNNISECLQPIFPGWRKEEEGDESAHENEWEIELAFVVASMSVSIHSGYKLLLERASRTVETFALGYVFIFVDEVYLWGHGLNEGWKDERNMFGPVFHWSGVFVRDALGAQQVEP